MDLRFSRFEIVTATGALFLCLVFVCVFVEAAPLESRIAAAAVQAAEDDGLFWVGVTARGRHVTVTGAALDDAARARTAAAVAAVPGVSGVEDRIAVVGAAGACQRDVDRHLEDRPVRFRAGQAELTPSGVAALTAVAAVIRRCGARFEVASHTDASGDAAVNLKLTERRAQMVARHLVRGGVPAERLRAVGYGETQPVADNATAAGRAENRRLQLRILGDDA